MRARIFRLFCFCALISALFMPSSLLSAMNPDQKAAEWLRQMTEAPSTPYINEDEIAEAEAVFGEAEVLLSGDLEGVVITPVGVGGTPIPMARLTVGDIKPLKGTPPEGRTFLYRYSLDTLKSLQGKRVLLALKSVRGGYDVTRVFPAHPDYIALLEPQSPPCAEESESACSE